MKVENYAHHVSVTERDGKRLVRIDRVLPSGLIAFYTELELPVPSRPEDWSAFEEVMGKVGRSIGIDSPAVRAHFRLDTDK